jgi:hypothetical protein
MSNQIPTIDDFNNLEERLLNKLELLFTQQNNTTNKKWLKSKDVRRLLGNISPGKLQEMRIKKEIPFTKLGSTYFYDYEEIVKILKSKEVSNEEK